MHRLVTTLRRGFMERIGWKRLGIAASLLIIAFAITTLVRTLKGVDTGVILVALTEKTPGHIALAALCVVGAFCTLTFYDFFALRTIGKAHVPYRIAALSSFTSYTIGHNIGATVFTGGAIRFRIYSDYGLNAIDVAKICFISGLTFWLGNLFVLGVGMTLHPWAASAMDLLPPAINRLIAFGCLTGIAISACFLAAGLAGAALLPGHFIAWLLVYLAASFAYTGVLKRIPLVDVLALSGMYILRLLSGGAVTHTPISPWLAGFSLFLFLSLAIVKRFAELEKLRASGSAPENGRGYEIADLAQLRSFGTASAYAAAVVFAIYISGPDVEKLYRHPNLLWLSVPLIILWLNRVWLLAGRGELNEDPVAFALTDRVSLAIGAAVVVVAALAV